MTKLEAPETPPPGTDARCTQLFGGGGGATVLEIHGGADAASPPGHPADRCPHHAGIGVLAVPARLRWGARRADALMRTPMGLAFGSGGLAALLAFLLGIVVMRPAMM